MSSQTTEFDPSETAEPSQPPYKLKRESRYGYGAEARAVQMEIGDFDYLNSRGYAAIMYYFGTTLKLRELKGILMSAKTFVDKKYGKILPEISRNTKRSYPLMIKYIDDNFDRIVPVFPNMQILDGSQKQLSFADAGVHRVPSDMYA